MFAPQLPPPPPERRPRPVRPSTVDPQAAPAADVDPSAASAPSRPAASHPPPRAASPDVPDSAGDAERTRRGRRWRARPTSIVFRGRSATRVGADGTPRVVREREVRVWLVLRTAGRGGVAAPGACPGTLAEGAP